MIAHEVALQMNILKFHVIAVIKKVNNDIRPEEQAKKATSI